MPEYKVTWEIDVDAKSPYDAALQARKAQEPGTEALVFHCKTKRERGVYIDLMEAGGDQAFPGLVGDGAANVYRS